MQFECYVVIAMSLGPCLFVEFTMSTIIYIGFVVKRSHFLTFTKDPIVA